MQNSPRLCLSLLRALLVPYLQPVVTMPGGARILVLEDAELVRKTLILVLERHGYLVRGFATAKEALEDVPEFLPQVLICDINLPDMNGIQAALAFGQTAPECRVLLLSGDTSSGELLADAASRGYHFDVLPKPTAPSELLAHIEQLIGGGATED